MTNEPVIHIVAAVAVGAVIIAGTYFGYTKYSSRENSQQPTLNQLTQDDINSDIGGHTDNTNSDSGAADSQNESVDKKDNSNENGESQADGDIIADNKDDENEPITIKELKAEAKENNHQNVVLPNNTPIVLSNGIQLQNEADYAMINLDNFERTINPIFKDNADIVAYIIKGAIDSGDYVEMLIITFDQYDGVEWYYVKYNKDSQVGTCREATNEEVMRING